MLDAAEEERSKDREWVANLVVSIISLCTPNKLQKRLKVDDFLSASDRKRAARRVRDSQRVKREEIKEREQALADGTLPAVEKSADWGDL